MLGGKNCKFGVVRNSKAMNGLNQNLQNYGLNQNLQNLTRYQVQLGNAC